MRAVDEKQDISLLWPYSSFGEDLFLPFITLLCITKNQDLTQTLEL